MASALVLAAVALGATLFSPWTFLLLVLVGSGIIAWEWGRLTRGNGFDAVALIEAVSVGSVAILATLGRPDLALGLLAAAAVVVGFGGKESTTRSWALAGLVYAALPALAILYLFAVAWVTDTASFAAGRLIGGPKLASSISPQKTWSGFIVGALTPALVGIGFAVALKSTSATRLALVSVALALACQVGDLFESWVKRRFGAKDMSQLIPGHGGLLDRVDGLLFAAVLAGLVALRDPANPGRALLIW